MNIAIIGGGAAGFFTAIHAQSLLPQATIYLLERSQMPLQKVLLSGGGRCNVTNSFRRITDLAQAYPRGHRLLRRCFARFDHEAAAAWFNAQGVELLTQEDERMFPASGQSEDIAQALRHRAQSLGVRLVLGCSVKRIEPLEEGEGGFRLHLGARHATLAALRYDALVLTTGGAARGEHHDWLTALGHRVESPCPSLFTFGIPHPSLHALSGQSVAQAQCALAGTKFKADGALLITHWGLSGPAVLKLSALAARHLHEANYQAQVLVSWLGTARTDEALDQLLRLQAQAPQRTLENQRPSAFSTRLWCYLLDRAELSADKKWGEVGRKGLNRLANVLTADAYPLTERGQYKDEFVTCGGVSLQSVHPDTLESKACAGLFFAGEVLDVDGITGGFNFTAAWSTAYTAAHGLAARLQSPTAE